MNSLAEFNDIIRNDEPLADHTWLKVGGPAQFFARPNTQEELVRLVSACHENEIPIRIFGRGSNLLVRDEGVSGVVLQLTGEEFSDVQIDGTSVCARSGTKLSELISHTVRAGLAGFEILAGIPGTIGSAVRGNAGGRSGDIGQYVKSVTVLTAKGEIVTREEDELEFGYRTSSINELLILEASFKLHEDDVEEITRRMRKVWIMKKATQPFSFQSAGCIFKNPRGISAGSLIDQAGLKGAKIGGAEISDRHANFIVTEEGATAGDVQRLIQMAQAKVSEQFGVDLELEIQVW